MRMSHIFICGLSHSSVFFHIIPLAAWPLKKVTDHKICVLIFSTSFVWNILHAKKKWARYNRKCSVRVILVGFNETCIFSTYLKKNTQIQNFIQILPVGAELFHADGGTDTKLVVAFRSFVTTPKNGISTGRAWHKQSTVLGEILLLWDFETSLCASRAPTVDQIPVVCITKYWSVYISLILSTSCARVCGCRYNYEHRVRFIVP